MRVPSTIVVFVGIASLIDPLPAEAQTRERQTLGEGRPLILRVRPRPSRDSGPAVASGYGQTPWYLVGSTYEPRNAFDPIKPVPPFGPWAYIVTVTPPVVSSASCRVTKINGNRYASPGCLSFMP